MFRLVKVPPRTVQRMPGEGLEVATEEALENMEADFKYEKPVT